jgi:hypothetical protein
VTERFRFPRDCKVNVLSPGCRHRVVVNLMNQALEPLPLWDFRHWYLVTEIVIPACGNRDPDGEGTTKFKQAVPPSVV